MKYLRWLLLPFAWLYGLVMLLRNGFYNLGIFKSTRFNLPIISVGNLDVGGSGKTPMTEYLVRLLKSSYQMATLSRGYGRETTGYRLVNTNDLASQTGDEPLQLKRKFPDITVAVCEDRVKGIEQLQANHNLILLDDAYQHRAVKPGFSILLFDYNKFTGINFMLPAGNRREPFSGRKRANVIIISKCPPDLTYQERAELRERMYLYPHQQMFFTAVGYLPLKKNDGSAADVSLDNDTTVFLLTGIAAPQPLVEQVQRYTQQVVHHKYPDHHRFSLKNITKLAAEFEACTAQKKIIITTEKDAQRLGEQDLLAAAAGLPIYTWPIGVEFLENKAAQFDNLILNYVRKH